MLRRFLSEVSHAGLPIGPRSASVVTAAEVARLPPPVRRYLDFMRVVGRFRDWSLLLGLRGQFRTGPEKPWLPCEAWQYDTSLDLARIFHIRLRFGRIMPVLARDTYLRGRGRMLGKVLGLITVADGEGDAFDLGELVTYLNDAILYAPSMLLDPAVAWSAVDAGAFDVTLSDRGHTVSARVFLDERGAPCDFHTTDRFLEDPYDAEHPLIRALWSTPADEWDLSGERPIARHARAVWQLPQGPFPYADVRVVSLTTNIAPGEPSPRSET